MDAIRMGTNDQHAIHVGKVKDSTAKVKINQTKKVHTNENRPKMSRALLLKNLKLFQLNTNGSKKVLSKRLEMYKSKKTCEQEDMCENVMFDFYVVIDFEATCDENKKNFNSNNQEIIEFPAILLNCHTGEVEDEFQFYCRPVINPVLTNYCIKLTGIKQSDVEKACLFHEVFALFNKWLHEKELGSKYSFAILTDGSKDIGHFLKRQCMLSQIDFPEYCKYWINIRMTFMSFYKTGDLQYFARLSNETVLNTMIEEIGYEFQGKAHSGLDDARNIAFVAQQLLEDGASLIFNETLLEDDVDKKESKSVFSSPVSKEEFAFIHGSFKPNFPAKRSPNSSNTPVNKETVPKDILGKVGTKKTTEIKAEKNPTKDNTTQMEKNSAKHPSKSTVDKVNLNQKEMKHISTKKTTETPLVKAVASSNPANGNSTKTKTKKNQPEDTAKILAGKKSAKVPSKSTIEKANPNQKEMKNMPIKDTLLNNSSKNVKASTSGQTRPNVIPAQASVKNARKNSSSKIETSAQNSKTADVLKQELMIAKKNFYRQCDVMCSISFKERKQLKRQIENLKKLLEEARSKEEQSLVQKNTTKLNLERMRELKVTQAGENVTNNDQQSVKNKCSTRVEHQLKREVSESFELDDGNHVIENSVSIEAEEERLFFEDFGNLLMINNPMMSENRMTNIVRRSFI